MGDNNSAQSVLLASLDQFLINNQSIREKAKYLQQIDNSRAYGLIAEMCQSQLLDFKETRLGKRYNLSDKGAIEGLKSSLTAQNNNNQTHPNFACLNIVKNIEGSKLIYPGPSAHLSQSLSCADSRDLLECLADNIDKFQTIREIHRVMEEGRERGPGKMQNELNDETDRPLTVHDKNLVEVCIFSKLDIESKFGFLFDVLIHEYDNDDIPRYKEYLGLILEMLDNLDELYLKTHKCWETFIKKLPLIDEKVMKHVYKVSKNDKNSILMYELVEYRSKEHKIEAVKYSVKIGHPKILKMLDHLLPDNEEFKKIVIPEAVQAFKKLITKKEKYDESSEDKIKRKVSPLLMCLIQDASVFDHILINFGDLPTPAKDFIKEKFDAILRSVMKSSDNEKFAIASKSILLKLYERSQASSQDNTNITIENDYHELLKLFKKWMKTQGSKTVKILSSSLKEIILNKKEITFFKGSSPDLLTSDLIHILKDLFEQNLLSTETIKKISQRTGLTLSDLIIETIFYPHQSDKTWPQLARLKEALLKLESQEELASVNFIHKLYVRLQSVLPAGTQGGGQPVPVLFMPFILELIMKMKNTLGKAKPWEDFMEIIKLLISSKKHREETVWGGLVRFARLDKGLLDTKIAHMLSSEDYEDLYNLVH